MTDVDPPPVALPSVLESLVRAAAQKGLTAVAVWLTTKGALARSQDGAFVDLGMAGLLWLASFTWTWLHEKHAAKTLRIALNAPAADPPVKV